MDITKKELHVGKFRNLEVSLPIIELGTGKKSVLITSGIHGDEFTGLSVIKKLFTDLSDAALTGKVTAIPAANPLAVLASQRETVLEGLDLNRSFKFEENNGSFTQKLAKTLFEFSESFDLVIDLHTFADPTGITAIFMNCGDPEFKKVNLDLISSVSPDVIWNLDVKEDPDMLGTFEPFIASKGMKTFALEMPDHNVITEEQLQRVVEGIKAVLAKEKILDIDSAENSEKVAIVSFNKVVSKTEGLFTRKTPLQSRVFEGEKVGEVMDMTSFEKEDVFASKTGILFIGKNREFVTIGDRLAVIGEVLDEV